MFSKIETAATTAVTDDVAVYYIKTAKNGSNHVLSEFWPTLKFVWYFQQYFQNFETAAVAFYYAKTA